VARAAEFPQLSAVGPQSGRRGEAFRVNDL
jgi:hypothetical protein